MVPYKDPEKYQAYQAAYHSAPENIEKARQRSARAYRSYTKEQKAARLARAKKWRAKNADKARESGRRWAIANPKKKMLCAARKRAQVKGLPFDLTTDDFEIPATCPVLDIPIVVSAGRPMDSSPSIDRIDNSKGYVKGNIIVVCWRANRLKSDATVDELATLAAFYAALARPFS